MREMTEQNPDRFTHAACKMRDSAVGHDDEVELTDRRSGVGEIVDHWRKVDDRSTARQGSQFPFGWTFLQTEELDPRQGKTLEEAQQRLRALLVAFEGNAA